MTSLFIKRTTVSIALFHQLCGGPDGELIVAFRRAPERRNWGATGYTHTDPNSYLVLVRSKDEGNTWSKIPELLYANPFGGSQDPCMLQLRDKTILCSSYGWAMFTTPAPSQMNNIYQLKNFTGLGGFILRSKDGAHSWEEPILPPSPQGETIFDPFGKPAPACNRGAMCEGKDGRIFWAVVCSTAIRDKTETHLMISSDKGTTWKDSCVIATDPKITFNETSLYETPKGDLLAFTRTEGFDDHTVIVRSTDGGKSFGAMVWTPDFKANPHYALRLPDNRVLLVYGYRHPPFGVRARVLNPECTDFAAAGEIILRQDGGGGDLGYPWAAMISKKRALVVYYFQQNDGVRHIAGTVLELPKNAQVKSIMSDLARIRCLLHLVAGVFFSVQASASPSLTDFWNGNAKWVKDADKIGADFGFHFVSILLQPNELWAYYIHNYTAPGGKFKMTIGRARGQDGLNWTNDGMVLDVGRPSRGTNGATRLWDDRLTSFPGVWKDGDTWYLVYEGAGESAGSLARRHRPAQLRSDAKAIL